MARQLGGTVHIESTLGQGTEVSLLLPRANTPAESDTPAAEPEPEAPVRRQPGELVLVVDDDYAVRQVTVEMLRDLGFDVIQAQGGSEALVLLDGLNDEPRLILLDYAMPGMNGLQLARRLRDRGLGAPIALVTGYAELNEVDAHDSPLDGLLRKPFTIRELQAMLDQLRADQLAMAEGMTLPRGVPEAAGSPHR
jgi:CheY-like chemotaxis protein